MFRGHLQCWLQPLPCEAVQRLCSSRTPSLAATLSLSSLCQEAELAQPVDDQSGAIMHPSRLPRGLTGSGAQVRWIQTEETNSDSRFRPTRNKHSAAACAGGAATGALPSSREWRLSGCAMGPAVPLDSARRRQAVRLRRTLSFDLHHHVDCSQSDHAPHPTLAFFGARGVCF